MKKDYSKYAAASIFTGLLVPPVIVLTFLYSSTGIEILLFLASLIPAGLLFGIVALFDGNKNHRLSFAGILINLFWICLAIYFVNNIHWRMF